MMQLTEEERIFNEIMEKGEARWDGWRIIHKNVAGASVVLAVKDSGKIRVSIFGGDITLQTISDILSELRE